MVRHDGSVAGVGKIASKIDTCRKGEVMTLSRPLGAVCNQGVKREGSYDCTCPQVSLLMLGRCVAEATAPIELANFRTYSIRTNFESNRIVL